jgi:hypothetical protein
MRVSGPEADDIACQAASDALLTKLTVVGGSRLRSHVRLPGIRYIALHTLVVDCVLVARAPQVRREASPDGHPQAAEHPYIAVTLDPTLMAKWPLAVDKGLAVLA